MNRVPSVAFRLAVAAIILCSGVSRMQAQTPAPPPPAQGAAGGATESICSAAGSAAASRDDGFGCERSALQADLGAL
jgi:hypothetical protein